MNGNEKETLRAILIAFCIQGTFLIGMAFDGGAKLNAQGPPDYPR